MQAEKRTKVSGQLQRLSEPPECPTPYHASAAHQDIPMSRESVSPAPATYVDHGTSRYAVRVALLAGTE